MPWATLLRPVSKFENAELEELWQANQKKRFDLDFFVFFVIPTLIVVVKVLQIEGDVIARYIPPTLLTLIHVAPCGFLWWRPAAYNRNRGTILSCFKLAYKSTTCTMALVEIPPSDTWFHFLRFELVLYQKGLLSLLGVSLPQPFLQHCAVQSGLLLVDFLYLPSICERFHHRQPSNYGRYQQIVTALDLTLPISTQHSRRDCPLASCGQTYCMHVQAFLNVMTGFLLPGLVMYAMECRSRLNKGGLT